MSCFVMRAAGNVMFCHGPPPSRPLPFRHAGTPPPHPQCPPSIAFRSLSFRSPRPRPGRQAGPCFARIAGGRGRAFAPARFARLIARARGSGGPLHRDVMGCHVLSWSAVSRPSLPPPGAPSSPLPPAGRRKRASVSFGPALLAPSAAPSRDPARRVMKCHVPSCFPSRCIPSSHFVPSPSSPLFRAFRAGAGARSRRRGSHA